MASFHSCLLVACAPIFISTLLTTEAQGQTVLDKLARAIYDSTIDFYQKIIESNDYENLFFSPTSIYVALTMLYAGAGGQTRDQLKSAMHLNSFQSKNFYEGIHTLMEASSSSEKNYTLKIANRLFGQKGYNFKDEYLKITKEYFRARLEKLDFSKDPSGSRSKINRWVASMTSDKIKELFSNDAITSDTKLVLANAVYFKSLWLHKFDKENTKPHTFYISKTQEVEVPMMNLQSKLLGYYNSETLACEVLELPYTGKKVSMLIFLPYETDGIPLLREQIRRHSVSHFFNSLKEWPVKLSLPKFTFNQTLNLRKTLEALGMKNLFDNADLSGISDSDALRLSEAIHKAYIAVDEEGSEAAGATGFAFEQVSFNIHEEPPFNFIVNRPFLFFVVDKSTGASLFFGQIQNPLKSD